MRPRAASWLAWSLAGLFLAMVVVGAVLSFLTPSVHTPSTEGGVGDTLVLVTFLAFPVVGALTASRRPRNPIGWICLTAGLVWMAIILGELYSAYGLAVPGSVPIPVTIFALTYAWLWVPAVGLFGIYLILLFPDGRLPSRRWRPLALFSGAVIIVESIVALFKPGPLDGLGGVRNPVGLDAYPWLAVVDWIVVPFLPLCIVASAASLVLRFRRSGGEVRQQIKWIAFAASFMGSMYLLVMSASVINWLIFAPGRPTDLGTQTWWGALLEDVMLLSFAGVPVAIGFAILRYRLYDIDIIINRTLVYSALSVSLALVYVGSVVVLQYASRTLTGGESLLAIVASTLAIAALFNPLRRRIQWFIDRRFYRRKYDAQKTLSTFSKKLREETNLEALNAELLSVIRETVQPEHVSLWLRTSDRAVKR